MVRHEGGLADGMLGHAGRQDVARAQRLDERAAKAASLPVDDNNIHIPSSLHQRREEAQEHLRQPLYSGVRSTSAIVTSCFPASVARTSSSTSRTIWPP